VSAKDVMFRRRFFSATIAVVSALDSKARWNNTSCAASKGSRSARRRAFGDFFGFG
jgi:hypothetical protein